ncbi:Fpg/Nei family DNA glycosylase [Streptomyces sp. NPDC096094]|uniref:Fpg/Nei family DNA glycosylase n=1 Tax=Streptomyces sp. NPDC096094 TaxID=3366073 RepID=UPI0038087551
MPEGHTIHRLAKDYAAAFTTGTAPRVTSPQGKFADAAALLTGTPLTRTEAHGKHLFLGFGAAEPADPAEPFASAEPAEPPEPADWIHIHLGLFGKVTFGATPAPPPTDTVRLRLANETAYVDLRGPTTCALITDPEKQAIHDRLGPDPLRPDADPGAAYRRVSRSRTTIAALLMDQKVIAGVGNVYRAEVLFRHGIDPYRPGRDLTPAEWDAIWHDLTDLMREGVRNNRIDTVRPEHTPEAMGRPPRVDDHGGEVYVYRRANRSCHLCGDAIRTADLAARNLFWCPTCQRGPR